MVKANRTRTATKEEGRIAWQKAEQFLAAAHSEMENERWDAAGLHAIHAGICASDAVLISTSSVRSASQDHTALVGTLEKNVTSFRGSTRTQLVGLLRMKNTVAYDQRLITQAEAHTLVKAADRYLMWAEKNC